MHLACPRAKAATAGGEVQVDTRARRTPMATKTEDRRSWLMWLLRESAVPLFLACLVGGALMAVSLGQPDAGTGEVLWDAGGDLLAVAGVLFIALAWGSVYLQVVEASRGMP